MKLHLPDNIVVEGETMSDIEAKLPQNDFIRVHRSYLESVSGIESFPNDYIEIKQANSNYQKVYQGGSGEIGDGKAALTNSKVSELIKIRILAQLRTISSQLF